jgi:DNA polymerase I-like protein with 3'-5' exonuclease and polymerase domains
VPDELAEVLEAYRGRQRVNTLLKTFGNGLAEKVEADGRIHGDIVIAGAVTGRMSSRNPNLQNMPGGDFRDLFIADEGMKLVVADYSQIEVRVGGLLADEPVLETVFKEGRDVHTSSAAMMFGVAYDQVTKEQRKTAKGLTFGMQYGMGVRSLAKLLGVDVSQAEEYVAQWKATYPKVAAWRDQSDADGRRGKELRTAGGRRIQLPDRPSPSVCYNYPVQGSAADCMYAALILLYQEAVQHEGWKLLSVVHDEVVMEVPESDAEEAARALEACMRNGYLDIFTQADCTGLVDAGIGDTWGKAK